MITPQPDTRSPQRRELDERIAAEPRPAPPDLSPDMPALPLESHPGPWHRPLGRHVAVAGVVENGLIRPLDPAVRLPERSRVIIVASETP